VAAEKFRIRQMGISVVIGAYRLWFRLMDFGRGPQELAPAKKLPRLFELFAHLRLGTTRIYPTVFTALLFS
jgi:hypothetical protein